MSGSAPVLRSTTAAFHFSAVTFAGFIGGFEAWGQSPCPPLVSWTLTPCSECDPFIDRAATRQHATVSCTLERDAE